MASKKYRSFIKGLFWELSSPIVLYIFVHEYKVVIGYSVVRIIMYYVYERIWKKIKWGKV